MAAPARKPVPKDAPDQLSAAECASRTGLTVRALRVYEREGLISPPRSAKGWRRYGAADLTRLNTIVILKSLGLTLSQIKKVLAENPPTLLQLLHVQAESWKEKRAAAERALTLVEAASERLRAQQTLSIDELCNLIKRLETNRSVAMKSSTALTRELINEHTTPEEERIWMTWWAEHPDDLTESQAFGKENEVVMTQAERLLEQGEVPGSPAAQALLRQHHELMLKYHVRERNQRQLAWNPEATRKWLELGVKLGRLKNEGRGIAVSEFWAAAIKQSPWGQAFREVLLEIRELMKTQPDPASPHFDTPIARIHQICAEHGLGDTPTFIEWRRFTGPLYGPFFAAQESFDAEWEFIERGVRARLTPS
jgi:DNA-binding transcriptional MerR regulator